MTPDLFIAKRGPGGPAFGLNEEQGAQSTGLPNRVSFSEAEWVGMAGSTFTHNHPGNASFSPDDYGQALFAGLHELRAVTPQFRRVLVLTDKVPSAQCAGGWCATSATDRKAVAPGTRPGYL